MPSPLEYEPVALAAAFKELYLSPAADGTLPWVDLSKVSARAPKARKPTDKMIVASTQIHIPTYDSQPDAKEMLKGYVHRCVAAVEKAVKEHDADVVLLSELFSAPYFCQSQDAACMSLAVEIGTSSLIKTFQALAKKMAVVLPISVFEQDGQARFNSIVVVDANGCLVKPQGGLEHGPGGFAYRKSHIPDGTGYQEKFYFSPGDTGFKVFAPPTLMGAKLGIAICWDQWFPEPARCMALMGADVFFYPTAIGSEPQDTRLDSSGHWRRVMTGHSAASMVPLVASNRVGTEVLVTQDKKEKERVSFYGTSFITDNTGGLVAECCDGRNVKYGDAGGAKDIEVISFAVHVQEHRDARGAWGNFRDRRPELYKPLLTMDGHVTRDLHP